MEKKSVKYPNSEKYCDDDNRTLNPNPEADP